MGLLIPKNLPRYECLLEASKKFPDLDPSACEAFLYLLRTGDELIRGCEAYFASYNMSQGRFGVMMQLLDKGQGCGAPARTPAELADMTGVTRATMTGLIDTLERDGLVTREHDSEDRRMMKVKLTSKGQALLHRILPDHFKRMAALASTLTESERKTLVRLLGKVLEQATRPAPQAGQAAFPRQKHHLHPQSV